MSERANPTVVGGFVVGALVLVVAGVLLFGSGALLRERIPVVAFFSGNVRGLQVGSAVEFRGVRVGTVTDIQLALDVASKDLLIPVFMELETRALSVAGSAADATAGEALPFLDQLVARGLRARLDLRSFVTGQLAVGLDMHPDTQVSRIGAVADTYELPTVPSTLDRFAEVLQDLPLQDIAVKLIDTLDNVARLLADDRLAVALADAAVTAADTRAIVSELKAEIGPLTGATRALLEETRSAVHNTAQRTDETLARYGRLATDADTRLVDLAQTLQRVLGELSGLSDRLDARIAPVSDAAVTTLEAARGALAGADSLLGDDSRTRYNLNLALEELAAAARSLRLMADFLEQNPDALLRGKPR